MRRNLMVNLAVSLTVATALLVSGAWLRGAQDESSFQHGTVMANDWARMTLSEKTYFVEGYVKGSTAGHIDACMLLRNETQHLPAVSTSSGIELDPCQGRSRSWSKGTAEVVKQITSYYKLYPDDRSLKVASLIQNLSDQSGLSLGQIHDEKNAASESDSGKH